MPNPIGRLLLPGMYQPEPEWLNRCHACPRPAMKIEHTCGKGGPDLVPASAEWDDWRDYAAALDAWQILLGPGKHCEAQNWDLTSEDPHFGLSAGTRRGKTNLLLIIAMQVLAKGGTVIALDPKLVSFEALEGLPGALVYCDPWNIGAMWGAIAAFRKEIERRAKIRKADKTARFTMLMLLLDELNLFSELSQLEWESRCGPRPENLPKETPWGGKKKPPMWNDLAMGLWTGAQFAGHVGTSGQRLDQRSTGNRGLRDSLGLRFAAGVPPNQVDMLFGPGEGRKVTFPNIRGRFYLGQGEDRRWVQVPRITDPLPDVADYVLSHRTGRRTASDAMVPSNQLSPGASYLRRQIGCTPIIGGVQCAADHLAMPFNTFKSYRQRYPIEGEFRLGRSPAWTTHTLETWRDRQ
jgi:hypothetical protein